MNTHTVIYLTKSKKLRRKKFDDYPKYKTFMEKMDKRRLRAVLININSTGKYRGSND